MACDRQEFRVNYSTAFPLGPRWFLDVLPEFPSGVAEFIGWAQCEPHEHL